jgi:parallel beta-helix repeat protein
MRPCLAGLATRLQLEALEDRFVLSTLLVTNLNDSGVGAGLQGDLRYALNMANSNADLSNRITFRLGLAGTITLLQGSLPILKNVEIDGPGSAFLTISGNHQSGVFDIRSAAVHAVRMTDLTVADGTGVPYNSAFSGGGLASAYANVTLDRLVFTGNTVGGGFISGRGGAIYNGAGAMVLNYCTISDNRADGPTSNSAANGGGIFNDTGTMTLNHTTITNNSSAVFGGGIADAGPLVLTDSAVTNHVARLGGGLYAERVSLTNSTIAGNVATQTGGGFYYFGETSSTLTNCSIADNTGGGIDGHYAALTLIGCTISGNSRDYDGAGVFWVGGDLTLVDCTIAGNAADGNGGGLVLRYDSHYPATVELTDCTLSGNSAASGGGVWNEGPTLLLMRNTIVAGNSALDGAADVVGPVLSLGHNLIGQADNSTGWSSTDLTGTGAQPLDPRLGPLQDNGGPTLTQAPLADSPAIDAGDPSAVGSTDQRGSNRQFDFLPPDIGAVEASPAVRLQLMAPAAVIPGGPFALTVVALDGFGNIATTYTGTVHFSSTDLSAQLPDDTAFPADAAGVVTVTATLNTTGTQTIAVKDLTQGYIGGRATVLVQDGSVPLETSGLTSNLVGWQFDANGWHRRQ